MNINSLNMPKDFLEDVSSKRLSRKIGSWELIQNVDFFGEHLETELGEIFDTEEAIIYNTRNLVDAFKPNGFYGEDAPELQGPSGIPDIVDFSKIVNFAISGDGAPFCFDFRDDLYAPSIIWWDDTYWRIIAPTYSEFINLFRVRNT